MTQTTEQSPYADQEETARVQRAHKRADDIRGLYVHVMIYLVVNAGLFVIDAVSGDGWWFYWPLLGWGIGLGAHAVAVFSDRFLGAEWEERKVEQILHRGDARRR